MEKLQERALRFVYSDNVTTYHTLLLKAKLLPLTLFRLRFLAIEVYKSVNKFNPQFMCDMFKSRISKYDLRNSNLLFQQRFKTKKYGLKSIGYYGAKLWNSLPACYEVRKYVTWY